MGLQGIYRGMERFTRVYKDIQGFTEVQYTSVYKVYSIPANFFLRYKGEIRILGVLGLLKTTRSFPKIPEEVFPRRPKS